MKNSRLMFAVIVSMLLIALLAGCAPQIQTPSPEDIQTALAQTLTAQPSATLSPTPEPTNTPRLTPTTHQTATPTTSPPISGTVTTPFLNMRSGPSTIFEILNTYVEDTIVTAISRTADDQWVFVEIEGEGDEQTEEGWMAAIYLEFDGEISGLPLEDVSDLQAISGRIEDLDGNPIPGIIVAVILSNDDFDLRTDTVSNAEGDFEAYLPGDYEGLGTFDVQIVSWNCDSIVANADCQFSGYVQVIDRAFTTLPQEEAILFTYEKTDMVVEGTVVDATEEGVELFNIIAERDDGATSFGRSDAVGEFVMPITPGVWEIFTIIFDPAYTEGERVSLEISDSAPEPVSLEIP